jgi:hypothetical protein
MSILYHYTDASGLMGILKNGSLWATNAGYLNDSLEFEAGRVIYSELFGKETGEILDRFSANKFYVVCFSSEGDLLSQWRGYANNGVGYSIGFNGKDLKKGRHKYEKLIKVGYKNEVFKRKIEKLYNKASDLHDIAGKNVDALNDFLFAFLTYKNPRFFEEREHRLILSGRSGLKIEFRARSGLIIPYINIEIAKEDNILPIAEIIIGPNLDFNMAKYSLELLLKLNGYDPKKINIRKSETSYR